MKINSLCAREPAYEAKNESHINPIHATSSFVFENIEEGIGIFQEPKKGHVYARYGNPSFDALAKKITKLENHGLDLDVSGVLVNSGMSAIYTLLHSLLKPGDHIITQQNIYGGTSDLLFHSLVTMGIEVHWMDLNDGEAIAKKAGELAGQIVVYSESPSNPCLDITDLKKLANVCKDIGAISIVDNTFCTPIIQQPLKLGIDYVIHSTTKYLNGHGNAIGGIIIGPTVQINSQIRKSMILLGTNANAFDAFLINNGLKTLALRMERHASNALALAEWMTTHPKVAHVNYPGLETHPLHDIAAQQMSSFGGMLSMEVKGGIDTGKTFMNALNLCTLAPTLGDVDTLVLHPATSSHRNMDRNERIAAGISDGLVRISVGIEDIDDIKKDIDQALSVC